MEKFKGLTERQNFPLIQGSNEKVPKIKVVTFDEIYNFAFRPKFKGAINLKLFLNPSKLPFANKHNLSFKILNVTMCINISFCKGKNEKQDMHFNSSQNLKILPFVKLFCKKDSALF